jgi:hypothetical protein
MRDGTYQASTSAMRTGALAADGSSCGGSTGALPKERNLSIPAGQTEFPIGQSC